MKTCKNCNHKIFRHSDRGRWRHQMNHSTLCPFADTKAEPEDEP